MRRREEEGAKVKMLNCFVLAIVLLSVSALSGAVVCAAEEHPSGPVPTEITVTVDSQSIPADGTTQSTITAHATDNNEASGGHILTFEIEEGPYDVELIPVLDGGSNSEISVWDETDENGYAYAKLKAGTTEGQVTIKVFHLLVSGTAGVTLKEPGQSELIVTNANASLQVIPEDTDHEPLWGELTNLSVVVTDDTAITSVTVNLSLIGGNATQAMAPGEDNVWYYETNASIGSAIFEAGSYKSHLLHVTATNNEGESNTSVSIALTVMKNGDVNVDGNATYSDAMYLYKWKAKKPRFDTIYETVADVNGDGSATYSDAMYLYKWKADKPGFDVLQ